MLPDPVLRVLVYHSRPAPPHPICLCGAISERLRPESFCSGRHMSPLARSRGLLPFTSNVIYSSPKTKVVFAQPILPPRNVLTQPILPPRPALLPWTQDRDVWDRNIRNHVRESAAADVGIRFQWFSSFLKASVQSPACLNRSRCVYDPMQIYESL